MSWISPKTIWDAITKPTETVDDLKDVAYLVKNALEPTYETGTGLKWRRVKRSYKRLGKAIKD